MILQVIHIGGEKKASLQKPGTKALKSSEFVESEAQSQSWSSIISAANQYKRHVSIQEINEKVKWRCPGLENQPIEYNGFRSLPRSHVLLNACRARNAVNK